MPNKIFGDVVEGYLVEGAKDKGYLKNSGKGFGDGTPSSPVKDYTKVHSGAENYFEGKQGSKGRGGWGAKGV